MFVAIVIVPLVAIVHWLFSIRPYCRRNGKGFTPGANIGVTYWADWQQITRDRNNQNILVLEILSAKPSRGPARRTPLLFLRQTTGIRNATIKPNYLSGTLNS
jgi:hypothetical protein